MAELPYPISGKDITSALQQMQRLMDDLYQERIAGALIGDVFEVGSDDILSLRLATSGGLEKSVATLTAKVNSTGGLQLTAGGLAAKVKTGGGVVVEDR